MNRIFIPTKSGSDWQPLLAKPKLHWKRGASAMTTAAAWEAAEGVLPAEISLLLDLTGDPLLTDLQLVAAFPEWSVPLPGGLTTSNTDVMAVCRSAKGLCVIGVEAKVLEPFGPTVGEKRAKESAGQDERLTFLHGLLGIERFADGIRYQLLHRAASALIMAREFHAKAAVMLIHAFESPKSSQADFAAFVVAMGGAELAPQVFRVKRFNAPALYLVWCDGDARFRNVELASVL